MGDDKGFLFATGKVVKDYTLLRFYLEELKARNLSHEHIVPTSELLIYIKSKAAERASSVAEILTMIEPAIEEKVDPESASKAVERHLNLRVDAGLARKMVARIIAGYAIEIAESLGYIELKRGEI